jgi:predicted O-methyltransferase YrrM
MPALRFRAKEQLDQVQALGREYGKKCVWPDKLEADQEGYYSQNAAFGYSSACLLHSMIRWHNPARVLEIGAGYSTQIISGALRLNQQETNNPSELYSIEPHPSAALRSTAATAAFVHLVEDRVENLPISHFESLQAGGLLFIDSSHVVRTGGDVLYLYLDVLPRLHSGVVVHVHDIYPPVEYSTAHFFAPLKRLWTEQYLLQAFLAFNDQYEISIAAWWLHSEHLDVFASAFPHFDANRHRPSSSFYMQRV